MEDALGLGSRQSQRRLEYHPDAVGRMPDACCFDLGETLASARDAKRHLCPPIRIDRKLGVDLDLVKNVQEASELGAQLLASLVRQLSISGLTSGKKRCAEERPRVAVARLPDESGLGNRNGKQRGEPRQDGQLTLHARDRDRTTGEAKRPLLLDHPHRVVPALAEQPSGCRLELGELVGEKPAHERLVDDDVGVPLGHRGTVPPGRVGSL